MRLFEFSHVYNPEKNIEGEDGGLDPLYQVEATDDIINLIKTKCSDILHIYKITNKPLYRGIKKAHHQMFIARSREDRVPTDSHHGVSDIINASLKYVDIKARRDNSIFCTGDKDYADEFGSPYVIFPVNGFNYTWSRYYKDVILTPYAFFQLTGQRLEDIQIKLEDDPTYNPYKELGPKLVMNMGLSTKDLAKVILNGHEVWLNGEYIAIHTFHPGWAGFFEKVIN
jgi:hypothetical protein